MRLVIRDEPTGPWHQLEGECDAEWQALEGAAAQGARTSGPSSEAEAAFVEAVTRLCCSLRVVRQSAGCVRATEGRVDQPAVLGILPSGRLRHPVRLSVVYCEDPSRGSRLPIAAHPMPVPEPESDRGYEASLRAHPPGWMKRATRLRWSLSSPLLWKAPLVDIGRRRGMEA